MIKKGERLLSFLFLKGEKMTLGEMKQRIRALLGLGVGEEPTAIYYAIDSTARRVAYVCKMIIKTGNLSYTDDGLDISSLPSDFISLAGENGTNKYYAYPPAITTSTADNATLGYDGIYADAVAYGAAAELCTGIYPGDIRRYMELATSYDERLIEPIKAEKAEESGGEEPRGDSGGGGQTDDPPDDDEEYGEIGNSLGNPLFGGAV